MQTLEKVGLYIPDETAIAYTRFSNIRVGIFWYATDFDGDNLYYGLIVQAKTLMAFWQTFGLNEMQEMGNLHELSFEPMAIAEVRKLHNCEIRSRGNLLNWDRKKWG